MAHHSSVNYVEPNLAAQDGWKALDYLERSPRLEDYSIVMNLEVEICSRDNIKTSSGSSSSDVLILSYRTDINNGSTTKVNFLGGTKIKCGDENHSSVPYLTTNYADMYVGDLIDYGTTEMIGVKNVSIQYEKSCVPIINMTFTDVRGLSLFQPTELSRSETYDGIRGINRENVAQSFFQCFFRMPMPKFTITIKGFYGKPVTYEMMCDKFDTSFNSSTGDFDVNTRFIGYSYSFLTDVSMDALVAAPYSDYLGAKYWEDRVNEGKFMLYDREGTEKPMPTLTKIRNEIKEILIEKYEEYSTGLSEEDMTHASQIEELTNIRAMYTQWYNTLYDMLCKQYGKDYCFDFRVDGEGSDFKRIIVLYKLPKNNPEIRETMGYSYANEFSNDFKTLNGNLKELIENYKNGASENKFTNFDTPKDFDLITLDHIFNPLYLNGNGEIAFNGFHPACNLPQTEVVNRIFKGDSLPKPSDMTEEQYSELQDKNRAKVLKSLYGKDGTDQYLYCYDINFDYVGIKQMIDALQADANRDIADKEKESHLKEFNDRIYEKMSWYPTIENFTKIMLAHLETLMYMMYKTAEQANGRTADELGITLGPEGNASDVLANSKNEVPPFPRVTRETIDTESFSNSLITKKEDTWVGEFHGDKGFIEVDMVHGLLNGMNEVKAINKETDDRIAALEAAKAEGNIEPIESSLSSKLSIKHPLSAFDFFLNGSPYGNGTDIENDINGYDFAGKVAIRMFNLIALNSFGPMFGNNWDNLIEKIATIEALNFKAVTKIESNTFKTWLKGISRDTLVEDILTKVTSADASAPWGETALFSSDLSKLDGYKCTFKFPAANGVLYNYLYPVQNVSFANKATAIAELSGLKDTATNNGDYMVLWKWGPLETLDSLGHGGLLLKEGYKSIENLISDIGNDVDNDYTTIFEAIKDAADFDVSTYDGFFKFDDKASSFAKRVDLNEVSEFTIENNKIIVHSNDHIGDQGKKPQECSFTDGIGEATKEGNVKDFFLKEVFVYEPYEKNEQSDGVRRNEDQYYDYNYSLCIFHDTWKDRVIYNNDLDQKILFCVRLNWVNIVKYLENTDGQPFWFLPKIAVLQMGYFACNKEFLDKDEFKKYNKNNHPTSYDCIRYLESLSTQTRLALAIYYKKWYNGDRKNLYNLIIDKNAQVKSKDKNIVRCLFNQNNDQVKSVTRDLLTCVTGIKISRNYFDNVFHNFNTSLLNKSTATKYLTAFIQKLRLLYNIDSINSEGVIVRNANIPTKTTNDIRADLYRYLKQLYDKWMPMNSFDFWKMETFFKDEEGTGHNFYFIDSFYNRIGNKLMMNPMKLSEKLDMVTDYRDVNTMMLGFMGDMYADNKCMMLSLQNFYDLKKDGSMKEMFKPISYNEIPWNSLNKTPSFVVVYPYEPSKNLNIPNNEFVNDGFMLNDETETPQAVRSKNGYLDYRIPAFGVSYGKQYQSYFKSININMQSPIATQQSIKAKHYILQQSGDAVNKSVVGQDLYDVYSTQSYTCEVEMMGCAWVQPLMYFVLLNVPMFRGSYMIMKVTHSITPGNMTTRFSGCRMANTVNHLIENIFTDELVDDGGSYGGSHYNVDTTRYAAIDNDCPYKVYPVYGDPDLELSGDAMTDGSAIMTLLMDTHGASKAAAAGIVGNMYIESHDYLNTNKRFKYDLVIKDGEGYMSGGLCMWHKGNLEDLIKGKTRDIGHTKQYPKYDETHRKNYSDKLREIGIAGQVRFLVNSVAPENGNSDAKKLIWNQYKYMSDPGAAAEEFMKKYERPGSNNKLKERQDAAVMFYKNYNPNANIEKPKPVENTKSIADLFNLSIFNSCKNTPSIGMEPLCLARDNFSYIRMSASKVKTAQVFDLIVSTPQYMRYVRRLYWVYDFRCGPTDDPEYLLVELNQKVSDEERKVYIACHKNEIPIITNQNYKSKILGGNTLIQSYISKPDRMCSGYLNVKLSISEVNSNFLKTAAKRAQQIGNGNFEKEFQQFVDQAGELSAEGKYAPQKCATAVAQAQYDMLGGGFTGQVKNAKMKLVMSNVRTLDDDDLGKGYVLQDNVYKHHCTSGPTTWYKRAGVSLVWWNPKDHTNSDYETTEKNMNRAGLKMVAHTSYENARATWKNNDMFRVGDIAVFHYYRYKDNKWEPSSHGQMFTGYDWRSDAIQRGFLPSQGGKSRKGEYSVCIYRHPDFQEEGLD